MELRRAGWVRIGGMGKVYVVMYYNYSDTYCIGASTDRASAYALAREMGGTVEEHDDAVGGKPEFYRPGWEVWAVSMNIAGGGNAKAEIADGVPSGDVRVVAGRSSGPPKPETFSYICWARDNQHAIKIANDVRTRWKAAGGWELPGWTNREGGDVNPYWHIRIWPKFGSVGTVA